MNTSGLLQMGDKDICLAIWEISLLSSFCLEKKMQQSIITYKFLRFYCQVRQIYLKLPCVLSTYFTYLEKMEFSQFSIRERSGSEVECLTRDRGAAGSSLTGVTGLCP